MQENGNLSLSIEELLSNSSFINYCLETNEEDVLFWNTLISQNPTQKTVVAEAKHLILLLKDMPSEVEVAAEQSRLWQKLGLDQQTNSQAIRLIPIYRWVAAAAVLLLLGLGSLYVVRERAVVPEAVVLAVPSVQQTTPAGKVMHLQLKDGTLVDLAAGSMLNYPAVFADSIRRVKLEGDARFSVARREGSSFVIETSDLNIRVLGTTFNVQSFQTDRYARIALFEGKVEINKGGSVYVIRPGEVLLYDKEKDSFETKLFDPLEEADRLQGMLIFNKASYAEVGQRLAHKYGIEFIPDENIELAFSGKIENESIAEVLKKLNFTTAYHFSLKSNTLIVKKK